MNAANITTMVGMIMKEPVFIKTRDGLEFEARFVLGVKRAYKTKEGKSVFDYIPVRFNGESRMPFAHSIHAKSIVSVAGSMQSENYEKDGVQRMSLFLNAESIQWTPRPREEEGYTLDLPL